MTLHPDSKLFAGKNTIDMVYHFMVPEHNDGRNLVDLKGMG